MKKILTLSMVLAFVLAVVPVFAADNRGPSDESRSGRRPRVAPTISVSPSATVRPSQTDSPNKGPNRGPNGKREDRAVCQVAAKDTFLKAKKDANAKLKEVKDANKRGREGKEIIRAAKLARKDAIRTAKAAFKDAKDVCKKLKGSPSPTASPSATVTPTATPTVSPTVTPTP